MFILLISFLFGLLNFNFQDNFHDSFHDCVRDSFHDSVHASIHAPVFFALATVSCLVVEHEREQPNDTAIGRPDIWSLALFFAFGLSDIRE